MISIPLFVQDRTLRVCTYSASSSDAEPEPEYGTNYFQTAEEMLVELTKSNKQGNGKFVYKERISPI